MKLLKRIGAVALAFAIVLGSVPAFSFFAQAGEQYSGRLWLGISRTDSSHTCTATCLHMTGTDKLLSTQGDISAVLTANDSESGIWLNGEKSGAVWLLKYHGSSSAYMLCGLEDIASSIVKDAKIEIKGTFKCSDQATYGTDTVTFEKSTFVFDGNKWTEQVETNSNVTMTLGANSNNAGIYTVPSATPFVTSWSWGERAYAARDGVSGIYLDGQWVNAPLILLDPACFYFGLSDASVTALAGSTVVIKGKFGQNTEIADFAPFILQFDGTTWTPVANENYSVTLTRDTAQASSNLGATGIYFTGTPDNVLPTDDNIAYKGNDADSGIWLNDSKQENAVIQKKTVGGNTYYWVGNYADAKENDVMTIKGRFTYLGTACGITLANEIKLKYTASGWTEVVDTPAANEFNMTAITGYAYVDVQSAWHVYMSTNVPMAGKAWNDMSGFMASVNGAADVAVNAYTDGNGAIGFYVPASLLPKDISQDYEIVIKAGEATGVDGTIYKLTQDFTLYINENGWATDNFIRVAVYKDFKFTNYVAPSGYNASGDRWDFYLTPSVELPGAVDTSDYFTGIKAKVQVGNGEEKPIDLMIFKVSHQNGTWIPIYTSTLPADAAETGFKVTILAGKADSTKDTVDGIELTEDFTLYVNQYGWSTEGYVAAPVYDTVTFTGLFGSGSPLFIEGQEESGWHLYLTPSSMLPGQNDDHTQFNEVKVEVDNGTKVSFARAMVHSSNEGTAWIFVSESYLPKNITKNTKITIKAGKYDSNNEYNGIEITEDFVIYANEHGWSTEAFVKAPVYTAFNFTGINSSTGYNGREDVDAWDFYLSPSVELPGKADNTLFKGIQMSINGGEKFDVNIVKSAHAGTAFIRVSTERIPKTITENTKIVLHAGKGLSDDKIGIELTKDFVIYANKYGMSATGYEAAPTVKESNVKTEIDRYAAYGGTEDGIYLKTTDHFPIDTSWGTRIKALSFDNNSGVFLNGKKLDSAAIIRYLDGKMYISLSDIGIKAKDKDKLTIKGTFALGSYAVSYKETSFYFNGKIWNAKYEAPKAETYKKINIKSVNSATGFIKSQKQWNLYFDVDTMLPGEIDQMHFYNFTVQIGSKTVETWAAHSFNHTLYIPIPEADLPENCKDGIAITIKAGKALGTDKSSGVELVKDFTVYTYKGSVFTEKPTTNTEWEDVTIYKLARTGGFNAEAEMWQIFLSLPDELETEIGTKYLQMPLYINGKQHLFTAYQEQGCLYISIPASILPGNTKSATLSLKGGTKVTANAGKNGIHITQDWTGYLFNGAISDTNYTEVEKIELNLKGLQAVTQDPTMAHVYIKTNLEFPGTTWYEYYNDFTYYYNGKKMDTYACKPNSSDNKLFYFPIGTTQLGLPKEGDILEIKPSEIITCGGYEVTFKNGFKMIYKDGVWSQYVESDVKRPADIGSLWSIARFNEAYIPLADKDGAVLFSGEDEYPEILSTEKLKDFTVSFTSKKAYDDEVANIFRLVLRGNAISENEAMSPNLLYGYVITFSPMEIADPENPEERVWSGYLELWKNGENVALTDQYRLAYAHERYDNPFFKYNEEYEFEFSIYNVTETCACIEGWVNGKLIMRYYDEASSDPFDPAVNAGTFGLYGTGPNYIKDDIVELDTVIAEKKECATGEEVRVSATYPAVIEGAKFTIDGKGATIKDGVFVAEKAGTYTISCEYNGKELKSTTITVTKAVDSDTGAGNIPVVPIVIGAAGTILLAGILVFVIVKVRKKKKLTQ